MIGRYLFHHCCVEIWVSSSKYSKSYSIFTIIGGILAFWTILVSLLPDKVFSREQAAFSFRFRSKNTQRICVWWKISRSWRKSVQIAAVKVSGYALVILWNKEFGCGTTFFKFSRKNRCRVHYIAVVFFNKTESADFVHFFVWKTAQNSNRPFKVLQMRWKLVWTLFIMLRIDCAHRFDQNSTPSWSREC